MRSYVFVLTLTSTLVARDAAVGTADRPRPLPLAKELVERMANAIAWNSWQGGDFFRLNPFSIRNHPGLPTTRYENGNFTFNSIQKHGKPTISFVGNHSFLNMAVRFVNVSGNYQSCCVGRYPDDKFHQIVTSSSNTDVKTLIRIRIDNECNGSIDYVTSAGPVKPFKVTSVPPTGPCPRGMSDELSSHYFYGIRNQTNYVIDSALTTTLANFKMC